jgi:hypothetical protein
VRDQRPDTAVDPGSAVVLGAYRAPDRPRSPDQPQSSAAPGPPGTLQHRWPQPTAAGFGIPDIPTENLQPWLLVKGVRDIASGLFVAVLLAYGNHRLLGWFMLAATFIPVGDALIVLRSGARRPPPTASTARPPR